MRVLKRLVFCLALVSGTLAVGAATIDLGPLGAASGTVQYSEPASYSPADQQTTRFLFAVAGPGTLSVGLNYSTALRSPLVEVCPDPDSCYVEPSGAYLDYSGVDLRSFTLG